MKFPLPPNKLGLLTFIGMSILSTLIFKYLERPHQYLPTTEYAILDGGFTLDLEVAKTPKEQAIGLINRPQLPDNRGMLFVFPDVRRLSFWMKNTPVPLDMIFLENGVVRYIESAAPCNNPCPKYEHIANQVLELRSNRSAELGIRVGDRIQFLPAKNEQSKGKDEEILHMLCCQLKHDFKNAQNFLFRKKR
jgi:uncharacterized membrane protein (UPF0127 family)